MGQHWPKSDSQRQIVSGPRSAALPRGILFCFLSFSSLTQEKSLSLIFVLILKLDLRE